MDSFVIRWVSGLMIGSAWSIVNFIFIINILKIAVLEKSRQKLFALLLLKFPVLYLGGFLILNSRFFPVSSLLAGLILTAIIIGAYKLWPKRT